MRFEFATATRIVFGAGSLREVAPAAKVLGRRALLVTGRGQERAEPLRAKLAAVGLTPVLFGFEGEPSVDRVRQGVELARAEGCDVVVALGGGSAIDGGKAVAVLVSNSGEPLDYLEVVGKGQSLIRPSLPFIAVPTTAGTGSEVTRNAVLASPGHRVKASLRSPYMLPRLAAVDPELTFDLPKQATASTGLDALTQLIEPYVSVRANPLTDLFCLEGLRRAGKALIRAWENGQDRQARSDMAFASLLGGLALANAGLGIVHGFAAPLGGRFPAPHGAVCAALLPHGMRANIAALRARDAGGEALRRYQAVACILTGKADAAPEDGAEWAAAAARQMGIPPLRAYGLREEDVPELLEEAARASSTRANPLALTQEELRAVLTGAL